MCHNIFITQIKRSKKIILYLGLLVLVSSFFVTSVNLYYNSIHNLQVAKNTFSTLVVTELYGEVDKFGKLVKRNSEEHIGYKAVGVKGYDFREWLKSDAVELISRDTQPWSMHHFGILLAKRLSNGI